MHSEIAAVQIANYKTHFKYKTSSVKLRTVGNQQRFFFSLKKKELFILYITISTLSSIFLIKTNTILRKLSLKIISFYFRNFSLTKIQSNIFKEGIFSYYCQYLLFFCNDSHKSFLYTTECKKKVTFLVFSLIFVN